MDRDLVLDNVKEDLDIRDTLQDTILNRLINKVIDHFKFTYSKMKLKINTGSLLKIVLLKDLTDVVLKVLRLNLLKVTLLTMKLS